MAAIDGLRAIAVLMVIAFHYLGRWPNDYTGLSISPMFEFGWLGVDLFFIISGYCIAMTASRAGSLAIFWGRRFGRIYPAYVAGVILTFFLVSAFGLPGKEVTAFQAAGNLVFLNALGFPPVDGVYWSLIVELKFYAIYGLLLCISRRPAVILTGMAAIFVIGLGLRLAGINHFDRLIRPEHIILFLIGSALFFAHAVESFSAQKRYYAVALVGFLASFTTGAYDAVIPYAAVTLSVGMLIIASRRFPVFSMLWPIGLISYSWYLLHQNIGLLIIRGLTGAGYGDAIAIGAATLSTFALAVMLYLAFESRGIRRQANRLFEGLFAMLRLNRFARQPA
ncbi:acyltransferase family protein [Thalassospira lucentensis]|uniref:acyltransferase family protein n=1 Tax=Thalassospira lucentensis TaxID=168935 RepID=UPI003AA7ECDF